MTVVAGFAQPNRRPGLKDLENLEDWEEGADRQPTVCVGGCPAASSGPMIDLDGAAWPIAVAPAHAFAPRQPGAQPLPAVGLQVPWDRYGSCGARTAGCERAALILSGAVLGAPGSAMKRLALGASRNPARSG